MRNKLILFKNHDYCAVKKPTLTVVMIHGIASESSTYNGALEYLEKVDALKNVRFVTFDLLGSGKSLKDDNLNYDYKDQLTALHNAIKKLKVKTPLVLVGHSLGTFIVTRYASKHKKMVRNLILVSPPIYTLSDLDNPAFAAGIKAFQDAVSLKNRQILEEKSFINSMKRIVLNRKNYQTLAELDIPITLVYGELDKLIAPYNIPKIKRDNHNIKAIRTAGRHGVSREKYPVLNKLLEEILKEVEC